MFAYINDRFILYLRIYKLFALFKYLNVLNKTKYSSHINHIDEANLILNKNMAPRIDKFKLWIDVTKGWMTFVNCVRLKLTCHIVNIRMRKYKHIHTWTHKHTGFCYKIWTSINTQYPVFSVNQNKIASSVTTQQPWRKPTYLHYNGYDNYLNMLLMLLMPVSMLRA